MDRTTFVAARRVGIAVLIGFVGLVGSAFDGCGRSEPKDLAQAADAIGAMASPAQLRESSFFILFPRGTPRQFVSFAFSTIGRRNWPPVEGSGELQPEEEAVVARVTGLMPRGVSVHHSQPDPKGGRQIVLRWDDARRIILLDAYEDPAGDVVFTREVEFRQVAPSERSKAIYDARDARD